MKTNRLIFLCIIVVIAAILIVVKTTARPREAKVNPPKTAQAALTTQTNAEGSVTVKVTPENVSEDKKRWNFRIVLDTHTGSLDEDVAKIATLTDQQKNTTEPLSWQGDPPGGHHREGVLQFPDFQEKPQSVTLLVRGIGGITERSFTWTIE